MVDYSDLIARQDTGASAEADRATAAEPVVSALRDGIPSAGMTPYGPSHPDYPNAPSDWDGGPYLCRDGGLYHMRGYGWEHGLGCWNPEANWDRVAYTAQGIEAQRAETVGLGSREPGGDSHAPNPGPLTNQDGGEKL